MKPMAARDLNNINKQIFETRQHIDRQREVIQKFYEGSQIQAIPQAEDQLKTLEDRLGSLEERRHALLDQLRRRRI
jgi:uncharacterized coiled-coil protein SlyX